MIPIVIPPHILRVIRLMKGGVGGQSCPVIEDFFL